MKKFPRTVFVGLTLTIFMVIAFEVNVRAEAGPVWSTVSFTVTKVEERLQLFGN